MSCLPVHSCVTVVTLAAALVVARPACAGPPLLCHPFDIGTARSLPWDGASWFQGRAGYDTASLVADTEALLTPATPVIVRMETLRRAAIYASRDTATAGQLLARLTDRAAASSKKGQPDPLALLDAAYITEALRQIGMLASMAEFRDRAAPIAALVAKIDGYALIEQSVAARPDDPAIHFAAALIAAMKDRRASAAHAQKARAGASQNALLARNIDHIAP